MTFYKKRSPVQVWSPLIQNNINDLNFKSDYLLAEELYDEEDIIWLSPKTKRLSRWKEGPIHNVIIPSKTLNKIAVYNIDEEGCLYPSVGKMKRLDLPEYKEWLRKKPKILHNNRPLKIEFPSATKKEAYYKYIKIDPDIAFIKGYKENKKGLADYKNKKNQIFTDYELERFDDFLQEVKSSNWRHIWPEPFNDFFITGGRMNLYFDFFEMKRYIDIEYDKDKLKTIQMIQAKVSPFISDTQSSLYKSWFMPKMNCGKDTLLSELVSFGLKFDSMEDLLREEEKVNILANYRVTVKRAYSWLGYFWWELYQDFLEDITVRSCNHCKRIIVGGRHDRKYCTQKENPICWKERVAARQKDYASRQKKIKDSKLILTYDI